MPIPRLIVSVFSASLILTNSLSSAQDYPNKPIRIVTGAPGGGGPDFSARLIAPGLSSSLGQPIIVENRGESIPGAIVAKAIPDGHTLLLDGGSFWIGPLLEKMPYDPVRDFSPIALLTSQAYFLAVHPSVPAKSVPDLITLAKAKPGGLNYGAGSTGSAPQLAAELFKAMAGVNIVRIPYRSGGQALTGLLGGEVQLTFGNVSSILPYLKSDRLRVLAITSAAPSALAPGVPTVAAILPGYEAKIHYGLFAPAKTPAPIINRLNREVVRLLSLADVKRKFLDSALETVGSSPAEAEAWAKADILKWGKLINDLGIKGN